MSTSGTVGRTVFTFEKILTQAMRRCRLNPAVQTAELVDAARTSMYLVFTALANRGLNLWRVEHNFLSVIPGQIRYSLPPGSIYLANLNFITNSGDTTGILGAIPGGYTVTFPEAATLFRAGIKFSAPFTGSLQFQSTADSLVWVDQGTIASATYEADRWYWFDLKKSAELIAYSVTSADAFTLSDATVGRQLSSIPLWPWNRDDYSRQPFRTQNGRPCTNYFFDRQIDPTLWVWPNPTNEYDFIEYWIHRQIQDINLLTEEIDVPIHWMNCAVWALARELCFLSPEIDKEVIPLVVAESDRALENAELGETDGSSMFIQPAIGVYTR